MDVHRILFLIVLLIVLGWLGAETINRLINNGYLIYRKAIVLSMFPMGTPPFG